MLRITREATQYLIRVRGERGLGAAAGARLVRTSAGVGLTFAPGPEPDDRVVENKDVPIYIAEDVSAALERSIIDVKMEGGESRLALRPQAHS
jgi:Fe-S cluster assembly iron-binding protein IscA